MNLQEANIIEAKNEGLISPIIAWRLWREERENNREKVDCLLESNKIVSQ